LQQSWTPSRPPSAKITSSRQGMNELDFIPL
jgi:hypothetical protein